MRRAAAVVTVLFGLWLVSLPFAFDLFDRTSNAEKVTDAFRSTLSARGIADLSANYGVIRGFGNQFVNETRPALAKQLGLSQAQFDRFVGANFPAVAAAVKGVPGAIALVDPVVPQLARLSGSGDFRKVDDIPGLGLPEHATTNTHVPAQRHHRLRVAIAHLRPRLRERQAIPSYEIAPLRDSPYNEGRPVSAPLPQRCRDAQRDRTRLRPRRGRLR